MVIDNVLSATKAIFSAIHLAVNNLQAIQEFAKRGTSVAMIIICDLLREQVFVNKTKNSITLV